jgi:hypothetical protein
MAFTRAGAAALARRGLAVWQECALAHGQERHQFGVVLVILGEQSRVISHERQSHSLCRITKSRWEIENEVFNDAENRFGLEHIYHHEPNGILLVWLLTFLAVMIERLYRIRCLHRGAHRQRSADQFCRLLWLSLSPARSTPAEPFGIRGRGCWVGTCSRCGPSARENSLTEKGPRPAAGAATLQTDLGATRPMVRPPEVSKLL